MFKIAILASGSGSNLQSIIDNVENGFLNCKIEMVIGSREGIYAIERAKRHNIDTFIVSKKDYGDAISYKILELVKKREIDLIVLAGYISILEGSLLEEYKDKIINIHPSLIPSFCGEGMYGLNVHKAVIESGVKVSGCTIHFVNNEVDGGSIILQEAVKVYFSDTPENLQKRVLKKEHKLLPLAIKYISEGKVKIKDGRVNILK
ncbi:phosphoribosylglycinamide formyltransferase [Clostridium sp. Ade.TY]|uniref:phosphoribosylglycinamide formyltransferase n=1 Tax=Clostridium sp. Ade.TY TaxID=1391647 RepID=UPI00041C4ED3|nr:phosphoribosylglycinamide formyltransferase [Clostridium sp. Ade.TY]